MLAAPVDLRRFRLFFKKWTFITSQSAAHLLLWFSGEPPGFHLFVVGGIQNCHVKLSCTPQKGCHPTILHGLQLMPRDILHCQLSLSLKALENVEPENRDGQWTKTCWMLSLDFLWISLSSTRDALSKLWRNCWGTTGTTFICKWNVYTPCMTVAWVIL